MTSAIDTMSTTTARGVMRAALHTRYGGPEVVTCGEATRPVPGRGEVLVRVQAAAVSIGDHHIMTGKPYVIRLTPYCGLVRPKHAVLGSALAGRIEALGDGVTTLRVGDEVFGESVHGAFAEFVVVAADQLAGKPNNLSFEEAAAVPWAVTALQALRDLGRIAAGQRVLIHGASGGVGSWAVQIAKAFGAHVTAVCSTRNVERVRALGADVVIDYTSEDFADAPPFDLIFDTVASRSVGVFRRALTPKGRYVTCAGGDATFAWLFRIGVVALTSAFSSRTLTMSIAKPNRADLMVMKELIEAGKVRPSIEQVLPLSAISAALAHVGEGHAQGQTVVTVA